MKRCLTTEQKLITDLNLVGPLRRLAREKFLERNYPETAETYEFLHDFVELTPNEIRRWKIAKKYPRPAKPDKEPDPTRHRNRLNQSNRALLRLKYPREQRP